MNGVESVRPSKEFLTLTLTNGKKHRLKGDFYHEEFEISAYAEHLRTAGTVRPTRTELAATLKDAEQLRDTYRTKRATYHQQHYATQQHSTHHTSARIASKRDYDPNTAPSTQNANNGLYRANRDVTDTAYTDRHDRNQQSENEYRPILSFDRQLTEKNRPSNTEPVDQSIAVTTEYSSSSPTSNDESKPSDSKRHPDPDQGTTRYPKSEIHTLGDNGICSVDSFNCFISGLADESKLSNDRGTTRNHSIQQTGTISNADRNRSILDRTKCLIESTKQLISRTDPILTEHLVYVQENRGELESKDPTEEQFNFSNEKRAYQTRAEQFFRSVTSSTTRQAYEPREFDFDRSRFDTTHSNQSSNTANTNSDSSLEDLANRSTRHLLQRFKHASRANQDAYRNCRQLSDSGQKLERLENLIANIRLKPKSVLDFNSLRHDHYYPDYVFEHKRLCKSQQSAYEKKDVRQLIDYSKEKFENIETYMNRAGRELYDWDYERIEKIIKNDQRMLRSLNCEQVLEPQNQYLKTEIDSYQSCLESLDNIKNQILEIRMPRSKREVFRQNYDPEQNLKPKNSFDFDF